MWLSVVGYFEVIVVITEKRVISLLDRYVALVCLCFQVMNEYAFVRYNDEHVFEYADFTNFEVAFEVIDISLIQKI